MAMYVGQGTVLEATIGGTLTAVAQVIEIEGPEVAVGSKETTNLASVAKTFRAQLPDAGTITFKVQYDPGDSTQTQLTTWANTWPQPLNNWGLTFNTPGGTDKALFSAFLTKFKLIGMNEDDNLEADCELKISGLVTWPTGTTATVMAAGSREKRS